MIEYNDYWSFYDEEEVICVSDGRKSVQIYDRGIFLRFIRIFAKNTTKILVNLPIQTFNLLDYKQNFDFGKILSEYITEYGTSLNHLVLENVLSFPLTRSIETIRHFEFHSTSNLREFNFNFRSLPYLKFFPNIETADLSGCYLIPVEINELSTSLRHLKMILDSKDFRFLMTAANHHIRLESLSVSLPDDFNVQGFFNMIRDLHNLEYLKIHVYHTELTLPVLNSRITHLTSLHLDGDFSCIEGFDFSFLQHITFGLWVLENKTRDDILTLFRRMRNIRTIKCDLPATIQDRRFFSYQLYQTLGALREITFNDISY